MNQVIKKGIIAGLVAIFSIPTYFIYRGYQDSITPSQFEKAAQSLGFKGYKKAEKFFSQEVQQEALLKIFYLAGYLHPTQLWQDIHQLGKICHPEKVFRSIYPILVQAKANQEDPAQFNAKYLRKNLFNGALSVQDSMDLILYIAQHAFNRHPGQERYEMHSQNWMEKYEEDYILAA